MLTLSMTTAVASTSALDATRLASSRFALPAGHGSILVGRITIAVTTERIPHAYQKSPRLEADFRGDRVTVGSAESTEPNGDDL